IIFQSLNGTIDSKAFGDSSQIDNHLAAKKDLVMTAKKDVTRRRGWTELIRTIRKIVPLRKQRSNRNIERAVALFGKPLCRPNDLPGPRMHGHAFWKSLAIHTRDVTQWIVKAH